LADNKLPGKIKLGEITTPVGVAVYPHLTKADTKWKAEGEYRSKLKYDSKIGTGLIDVLQPYADKAFEEYKTLLEDAGKKAKIKSLTKAALPIKPEVDEEGDETGNYILNTKRVASGTSKKSGDTWYSTITLADSKGKVVGMVSADPAKKKRQPKLSIWSGSELRVIGHVMGWYHAKDNEVGISVEIAGVQIKKLVSGGDGNVEFEAMDDEDGWSAPDETTATDPDDATDTDADDVVEDAADF
jgi:hypothetical protein